ncbi:MAG: hypothetical protein ACFFAN_02810 [Promethearchaeota archaeon]
MNPYLFCTYLITIVIFTIVILVIFLAWRAFFPKRWLIFLVVSFTAVIAGLSVLLLAELMAPYNSNYYFNPFLYIIYFGLIGCSMFSIYLLVIEIHYKHIKALTVIGYLLFIVSIIFLLISSIFLSFIKLQNYLWITYLAFELIYAIGIIAYILLAIGSFSNASSDRLERKVRIELILVGVLSLGIAFGLSIIAIGILFVDFSIPLHPSVSIFWLLWISFVAIMFLVMVRRAIGLFT